MIFPFLSQISFTNPLLKFSILLFAIRFNGAIAVLYFKSRFKQSSSLKPTLAISGQVEIVRGASGKLTAIFDRGCKILCATVRLESRISDVCICGLTTPPTAKICFIEVCANSFTKMPSLEYST